MKSDVVDLMPRASAFFWTPSQGVFGRQSNAAWGLDTQPTGWTGRISITCPAAALLEVRLDCTTATAAAGSSGMSARIRSNAPNGPWHADDGLGTQGTFVSFRRASLVDALRVPPGTWSFWLEMIGDNVRQQQLVGPGSFLVREIA